MSSAEVSGGNSLEANGAIIVHSTWGFGLLGYFLLRGSHTIQRHAKVPELAGTPVRNKAMLKQYNFGPDELCPHRALRNNAK